MRVIFEYSVIYDDLLTEMSRKQINRLEINEILEFKSKFEKYWKKKEGKIIRSIEKNSSLKFKTKDIKCYFVNHMLFKGISDPLTIKLGGTIEDIEITLIHELIHCLLMQNKEKVLDLIKNTYPEEDKEFRIHVPVLLIEKKVVEDIFNKIYFQRFEALDRKNFKYEWQEVNKLYPDYKGNIIKFLKNETLE